MVILSFNWCETWKWRKISNANTTRNNKNAEQHHFLYSYSPYIYPQLF